MAKYIQETPKRTKKQQKKFLDKQKKRQQSISRTHGLLSNLTGDITVAQYFDALEKAKLPGWIIAIRPAGRKLQAKGIQAVAETDIGFFHLQIKSSIEKAAILSLNPKRNRIPILVVLRRDKQTYIVDQTIKALEEEKNKN